MSSRPYPHRIERTKNKHSRAVFREDTIIIRLARNLSKTEEREHISDLLDRMTRQLLEEEKCRVQLHPFQGLLSGQQSQTVELATGRRYRFRLRPGTRLEADRTQEGWTVRVGPRTRRAQLHRFLWSLLAEAEYDRIDTLVESLNDRHLGVKYREVRLRFASSQWGSCSPKGIIMLNAALLFVPPSLLKYVIIHELAHRRRADHSPAYWRIVESALPGYRSARERLHDYRLPTL